MDDPSLVQEHYAPRDLVANIQAGLKKTGKDVNFLNPKDLASVDQLHTGGAPATLSLLKKSAGAAGLPENASILDAGCGLGGTSRLMTNNYRVTGIDISATFIEAARQLSLWCGLDIDFHQGSILDLPFDANSFDAVLCQHILMNIQDKKTALGEIFRVLKPGGTLMFHEICRGTGPPPAMPVPWAKDPCISFLVPWKELKTLVSQLQFKPKYFSDATQAAGDWWQMVNTATAKDQSRPLGPKLVFGENASFFGPNMEKNFKLCAIQCVEAVFVK